MPDVPALVIPYPTPSGGTTKIDTSMPPPGGRPPGAPKLSDVPLAKPTPTATTPAAATTDSISSSSGGGDSGMVVVLLALAAAAGVVLMLGSGNKPTSMQLNPIPLRPPAGLPPRTPVEIYDDTDPDQQRFWLESYVRCRAIQYGEKGYYLSAPWTMDGWLFVTDRSFGRRWRLKS